MDNQANGALQQRIVFLEKQVKGLMETVKIMHERLGMSTTGVPVPDIYILPDDDPRKKQHEKIHPAYARKLEMMKTLDAQKAQRNVALVSKTVDPAKAESYVYTPLTSTKPEVRVLALKKNDNPAAPIECRLIVVNLNDISTTPGARLQKVEHAFTPLSYTWGDAAQRAKIYIDGKFLSITAALHTALVRFRKLETNITDTFARMRAGIRGVQAEQFWWIDAICVNQQDLAERSAQVVLMTRLYRSVQTVHVWLGESSDESALAMKLIRYLAYQPNSIEAIESWRYIRKPGQTHRPGGPGQADVELPFEWIAETKEEKQANFEALVSFFQRPWLSRVWVRQEVALPESVMVHCGDQQCSWNEFMKTASIVSTFSDQFNLPGLQNGKMVSNGAPQSCFQAAVALGDLRIATEKGTKYVPFQDLVFDTRNCLSTDPKDKIYSMLPLTNPDELKIEADYGQSAIAAYKAALIPTMQQTLDLLAACQYPQSMVGGPQWIPDFSQTWNAQPLSRILGEGFRASHIDFQHGSPNVVHDSNSGQLRVESMIIGEILKFHDTETQWNDSDERLKHISTSWWDFSQAHRANIMAAAEVAGKDPHKIPFINSMPYRSSWDHSCLGSSRERESFTKTRSDSKWTPSHLAPLDSDPIFRRTMQTLVHDVMPESIDCTSGLNRFRSLALGRRAAVSEHGLIGLVPKNAEVGDKICWFKGSRESYILRAQANDGWVIIGTTFLLGEVQTFMTNAEPETIVLI